MFPALEPRPDSRGWRWSTSRRATTSCACRSSTPTVPDSPPPRPSTSSRRAMPQQQADVDRRTLLKGGAAAALTGLTVVTVAGPARAFPGHTDGGVVIPWLDQPTPVPPDFGNVLAHPLVWEDIEYLTPTTSSSPSSTTTSHSSHRRP